MVLAAGRGERMRPLTDQTPKPLLPVRGQPLMLWPMQALARGGFVQQLINTAWLGEQIPALLGDQARWPELPEVHIRYSHEGQDFGRALETAGGIVRALPQLDEVFWVVAGDVFAPDMVFTQPAVARFAASAALAHLWLVPNPTHNPGGDFGLSAAGQVLNLPKGSPECACGHCPRPEFGAHRPDVKARPAAQTAPDCCFGQFGVWPRLGQKQNQICQNIR